MSENLTGNPATYHPQVTVPTSGDDRTALSVRGAFQYLADNDAFLKARGDKLLNDDPYVWAKKQRFLAGAQLGDTAEFSYQLTTTRKVLLPLVPLVIPSGWICSPDPSPQWACGNTLNALPFLIGPDVLRSGGTLTRVRAAINTSVEARLVLNRITYDTSDAGGAGVEGPELYATYTPSGTQAKVLDLQFAASVDNAASHFRISIRPMASAPSALQLRWLELSFWDPGPRNF